MRAGRERKVQIHSSSGMRNPGFDFDTRGPDLIGFETLGSESASFFKRALLQVPAPHVHPGFVRNPENTCGEVKNYRPGLSVLTAKRQ